MKTTTIMLTALVVIVAACSTSKKSTKTTVASTTTTTAAKPADGIYDPGSEELTAIQVQYKEVTLAQLKEGYAIYAQGACTKCHGAKNIYKRGAMQWKGIMDDMAQKARLTDSQKDAVYKYVLAIKAAKGKDGNSNDYPSPFNKG